MFVRVVALNTELSKYESWEGATSNSLIKGLFDTQRAFETTKGMGVGQTTILKFPGQLIRDGQQRGEIAKPETGRPISVPEGNTYKTLSDIGISRKESSTLYLHPKLYAHVMVIKNPVLPGSLSGYAHRWAKIAKAMIRTMTKINTTSLQVSSSGLSFGNAPIAY